VAVALDSLEAGAAAAFGFRGKSDYLLMAVMTCCPPTTVRSVGHAMSLNPAALAAALSSSRVIAR